MPTTIAARDRRHSDERLAVVETELSAHLDECVKAQKAVESRLSRIEKGILAVLIGVALGGLSTTVFLLKILLHLG